MERRFVLLDQELRDILAIEGKRPFVDVSIDFITDDGDDDV